MQDQAPPYTQVGLTVNNGYLLLDNAQGLRTGNVYFTDESIQQTAYIKPTANVLPSSPALTSVTLDLSSSNAYVHCHCNYNGNLTINIVNPTPAKCVELFAYWPGYTGSVMTISGISGGNIHAVGVVASNTPIPVNKNLVTVRVVSMDTTTANTFAVVSNY
jgi:hypothetical protein